MEVIVSHDVDHITAIEHYKDTILPKYIVRNHIELFKSKLSTKEYFNRWLDIFNNKWENIKEIMDSNDTHGIKSNFFFGVNNGVGLSYNLKHVKKWAPKVLERGFEVGVHGIDFDSQEKIDTEFKTFQNIIGDLPFGIRMHYLRANEHTFNYLSNAGYLFDASEEGMKNPYQINNMWEFPLQLMEGRCFYNGKRYQAHSLKQAKSEAIKSIETAEKLNLKYFNVLFHDRYYSTSYQQWKDWYDWIIDYLKNEKKYTFTTYSKAIKTLEKLNDE